MKSLAQIYPAGFFARRYKLNWRAPLFCDAAAAALRPTSVVDVGCAAGDLVAEWRRRGVDAWGVEGSTAARPFLETDQVVFWDVTAPASPLNRADLAVCLEVLEHIPADQARAVFANLVRLSTRLLVSAAPPGQGGHHHVNCRPVSYWTRLAGSFGYARRPEIEEEIKERWLPWKDKPGLKAFFQNLVFFEEVL